VCGGACAANLKKCTPSILCADWVAVAIWSIGIVEVLVASMQSGLTTFSTSRNTSCFTFRFSTTAFNFPTTTAAAMTSAIAILADRGWE
jgi:hypothetical protein